MNYLLVGLMALVMLSLANVARAQDAFPAWSDVLRTCSAEYRERADKTKGREIWQAFLTDCKARKGFVAKRDQGRNVEFTRVPDKAN